jgi:predicted acetyltransferase
MLLRELDETHADAFLDYARDFEAESRNRGICGPEGFSAFLSSLRKYRDGTGLPPGVVASFSWFAFDEGRILGRLNFRPEITPAMFVEGGHIGYEVRLSDRGRGWATRMLGTFLTTLDPTVYPRVLVTCDRENPASRRVIEKNGGIFEACEPSPRTGRMTERFWVPVGRATS